MFNVPLNKEVTRTMCSSGKESKGDVSSVSFTYYI